MMIDADSALHHIHMQVMWNRLVSVVEEQAQTLIRTAFGTATREAGDLSAGVFLPDGRMIAQAVTGTPGHVNSMAQSVGHFVRHFGLDAIRPQDVFLTNDPWKGTGHLNDMTVVTPVFHQDRLVAFFAATLHVVDIGGLGLSADGTQIFHEGLYLPLLRLIEAGSLNATVMDIVRANVREPVQVEGDIYALVACNDVGSRRLLDMLREFALEDIGALGEHIIARSRQAMLDMVARWPRGSWASQMTIDGVDAPITLAARLTIGEDGIDLDFAGSSACVIQGINVPLAYTDAYASFGVRCVIGGDIPNNAGSLSVIRVTAPAGSILNAQYPSAVAARSIVGQMLPDVVFGCLRQALPDSVPAEGTSALWSIRLGGGQVIKGIDPAQVAQASYFNITGFNTGGTGARPGLDGLSVTSFPSGIRNVSVEILETLAPVLYRRKELKSDTGGAGRLRGGLGQVIEIENREHAPMILSATFDRIVHPARGAQGGGDGARGSVRLASGQVLRGMGRQVIPAGDRLIVETPGGAGIGSPTERSRAALEQDLAEGLISAASAQEFYGYTPSATLGG